MSADAPDPGVVRTTVLVAGVEGFNPQGMCLDNYGNVVVADFKVVRLVRLVDGDVRIFVRGFDTARDVCGDVDGNIIVADQNYLRKIWVHELCVSTLARMVGTCLNGVCLDSDGNIIAADDHYVVHRVSALDMSCRILAGYEPQDDEQYDWETLDGPGAEAHFRSPNAVCLDGRGNLLVADAGFFEVRRVRLHDAFVTTLVSQDGCEATAVCVAPSGDVFIADDRHLWRLHPGTEDGTLTKVVTWDGWKPHRLCPLPDGRILVSGRRRPGHPNQHQMIIVHADDTATLTKAAR